MKTFLNSYFGFNRQQRNGLVVLMWISLSLLFVRIVYPCFLPQGNVVIKNIPFRAQDSSAQYDSTRSAPFDPNTASAEELVRAGFPKKTALTLVKYRERHPIRNKKDLLKVYGMTQELYDRVSPRVRIAGAPDKPGVRHQQPAATGQKPSERSAPLELNSSDSTQLETVDGIGPVFARRIVKYRDMLGGFVSVDQLKEVYGIKEEAYRFIRSGVTADPSLAKKLNLNTDDFKTINRHPYISYDLTRAIFDARRKAPVTPEILRSLMADDSLHARLEPYVTF